MWRDPIVEEIRKWRREYAARFHYDLNAICQDLRQRQKDGGRQVVSLPPRLAQQLSADRPPASK